MLIRKNGDKQLKQLLEQMQNDWNSLKDKLEIDIVEKYIRNVKILTISVMGKRKHSLYNSNVLYINTHKITYFTLIVFYINCFTKIKNI